MDSPLIVLTTDFGTADAYAGVMKGVILSINPRATIVDLTHQVQPQNIRQAAFILSNSYRFFPDGTIHVAVVDPGVGTERRALLVVTPSARFLAPDNGVLSLIIQEQGGHPWTGLRPGSTLRSSSGQAMGPPRQETAGGPAWVTVPAGCWAYQLTNPRYWRHPVSATFQGRDIFAPVAAYLSLGAGPEALGPPVSELIWLGMPKPTRHGKDIYGEVIYTDHFGNLITNVSGQEVLEADSEPGLGRICVEIKGQQIGRLSRTYQEKDRQEGGLLALIGSHGYLEIAVRDGNAAAELGVAVGEPVHVAIRA